MADANRIAAALRYQQGMALPTPEPDSMVGRALDAAAQWGRGVQKNVSDLVSPTAWAEALKNPPRGVLSQMNPENKQEMVRQGIDAALDFGPGALGKVAPAMLGTFIGKNAKNWNIADALKAAEMEGAGVDPQTIWKETGTWKGPEGQWRQEISDKGSKITEDVYKQISSNKEFKGPMEQALQHEELYKAYPQSAGIPTTMFADIAPSGNMLRGRITVGGPSSMDQRSVALHELQHAIQQREGFARGGSPNAFKPNDVFSTKSLEDAAIIDKLMRGSNLDQLEAKQRFETIFKKSPEAGAFAALERVGTGKELDAARDAARLADKPMESYRRLAGEAEARATQKRRNMTTEERRAKFPVESYDVPINQLIIRQ